MAVKVKVHAGAVAADAGAVAEEVAGGGTVRYTARASFKSAEQKQRLWHADYLKRHDKFKKHATKLLTVFTLLLDQPLSGDQRAIVLNRSVPSRGENCWRVLFLVEV